MDNYHSEYVLAQLKRNLVEMSRIKDDGVIWYPHEAAKSMLCMLAEIEADSVLGTPELVGAEVNKLLNDCPVDFGEVDI